MILCTLFLFMQAAPTPPAGLWRCEFTTPGGPLPFQIMLTSNNGRWEGYAINADEHVPFDQIHLKGNQISLEISHYESFLRGTLSPDSKRITGQWEKTVNDERKLTLPFKAEYGQSYRFASKLPASAQVQGTWKVSFQHKNDPPQTAFAEFFQNQSKVTGTFLTSTGDYRFLEGLVSQNTLKLSCFDGSHAFLFQAELDENGALVGDFWSGDQWHEAWTATRVEKVQLEDPYALTRLKPNHSKFHFQLPDLSGQVRSQDDPAWTGKVRAISIFGSWCPNCNDEAEFLQELQTEFKDRGFTVIGLAFEATANDKRNIHILNRFIKRHKITYPILYGGEKSRDHILKQCPDLEVLKAFPSLIFVNAKGKVTSIYTGFSGPGTGKHYEDLGIETRKIIEGLLKNGATVKD